MEQYLLVRTRGMNVALPLHHVGETLRLPSLPAMASKVPALRGMMLLRGENTPVLDLALLLGYGENPHGGRLVSVRVGERMVALLIDDVTGVRELEAGTLDRIDLPGGNERVVGVFDRGFARVIDAGGIVPEEALV